MNTSAEWGLIVKTQIEYYLRDLHSADGLYHHSYSGNCRSFQYVLIEYHNAPDIKRRKSCRPKNEDNNEQPRFTK